MMRGFFGKIFGGQSTDQPDTATTGGSAPTTPVKTPQRAPGTPFSPPPATPLPSAPQQPFEAMQVVAQEQAALYRSDGQVFQPVFLNVEAVLDKAGSGDCMCVSGREAI